MMQIIPNLKETAVKRKTHRKSPDLCDFNTIVYGHRMNNGSMFAPLKNLLEAELLGCPFPRVHHRRQRQSQVGDLRRLRGLHRRDTYHLGFPKDSSKQAFIDYCLEQSVIDSGITLTVYDRVLTLSTCTGNGHATRWVDQAVLKCVAPSDAAQKAPAEPEQQPETEPAPA